ncbi:MAG TPA: TonB-dependent receptor [Burkholderiaceae bacterium]
MLNRFIPRGARTLCATAVTTALTLMYPAARADDDTAAAQAQVVVVTAQSRTQQIQNVPIAMQALSGASLQAMALNDLAELDAYVPGLAIDASQSTRPLIFLRGIGTFDFGIGTDSPVGIYTDGVYAGKTGGSLLNFNDVKRIEVLKGPQGTLFGRNAAAGAIAIVTNDPSARREASATVRIGESGRHHEEVVLNAPLGERAAMRLSAVNHRDGGWLRNRRDGARAGGDDDWGTRLSVRLDGDAWYAVLGWEHEKLDAPGPATFSLTGGQVDFSGPKGWKDPTALALDNDAQGALQARTFDGATLRVERKFGGVTFNSTTAYRRFESQNVQDNDGSSNPAAYLATANLEKNRTWQQEFRLSGQYRQVDWVAGASAYDERADQTTRADLSTTSIDTIVKASAGLAPYATLTGLAQGIGKAANIAALQSLSLGGLPWQEAMINHGETRAYAVYGDAIWQLGAATRLTLGGRITRDEKDFSWFNPVRIAPQLDSRLAILQQTQVFPTAVNLKLLTPQAAGLLQNLPLANLQFNNAAAKSAPFRAAHSWNNFSPRVVLDHRLGADHMAYASWSKGYQSGGFDSVNVNGRYEEEKVRNVELGAKGGVRQLGLSYAASVFRYAFTNLQSLALVPAAGAIPSYQISSSDQKATGADLEAQWKIDGTWRVHGAAEYLNQRYGTFIAPGGVNLTGQAVGAPFWTVTAGASARWSLFDGEADASLQLSYAGERRCNADTTRQGTCQPDSLVHAGAARERADLRLGWQAPSRRWGVAVVINNLADKRYVAGVSTLGGVVGSPYAYLTRPRTAALEVRVKL